MSRHRSLKYLLFTFGKSWLGLHSAVSIDIKREKQKTEFPLLLNNIFEWFDGTGDKNL